MADVWVDTDIELADIDTDDLIEELEDRGYNVTEEELADIDEDELIDELKERGYNVTKFKPAEQLGVERDITTPGGMLETLRDLAGLGFYADKELIFSTLQGMVSSVS